MVRRARPVRDRIVPEVVERLTREFKYPETEAARPASIEAGTGGAPTVVVAASSATELSKSKADFICSGGVGNNVDHHTIMAAIDLLASSVGGRILLTEGSYFCNFGGLAWSTQRVTIQGLGPHNTQVNFFGGSGPAIDITGAQYTTLRDFAITGPDLGSEVGIYANSQALRVQNVFFQSLGGAAIHLDQTATSVDSSWIENCWIDQCNAQGILVEGSSRLRIIGNQISQNDGHCIEFTNDASDEIIIANNNLYAFGTAADAIRVEESVSQMVVDGNVLVSDDGWGINLNDDNIPYVTITANVFNDCSEGAVRGAGSPNVSVVGNSIFRSAFFGTGAAIDFSDPFGTGQGFGLNIADNIIDTANANGISVDDYGDVRIAGNILRNIDGHGIVLNDISDAKISGNLISNVGGDGTNTFDGIILSGDSDRNMIDGNKIVPGSVVLPRYAINISAATCDCNFVVGNGGGPSGGYGTGTINDAGTNTQLFYPSHPIEGDNLFDCPPDSS